MVKYLVERHPKVVNFCKAVNLACSITVKELEIKAKDRARRSNKIFK